MLTHFYDLQRLLGATFSMEEEEEAKYHPLTRFALWRSLVKTAILMVAAGNPSQS